MIYLYSFWGLSEELSAAGLSVICGLSGAHFGRRLSINRFYARNFPPGADKGCKRKGIFGSVELHFDWSDIPNNEIILNKIYMIHITLIDTDHSVVLKKVIPLNF